MADLNLRPLRLRELLVQPGFILPYLKAAVFGTHMKLNPDYASEMRHVFNAGIQLIWSWCCSPTSKQPYQQVMSANLRKVLTESSNGCFHLNCWAISFLA